MKIRPFASLLLRRFGHDITSLRRKTEPSSLLCDVHLSSLGKTVLSPLFIALAFVLLNTFSAIASNRFNPVPCAVFTGADAGPWERVERLEDKHPGFTKETFAEPTKIRDKWLLKWFGSDTPSSNLVLLHCAKNYAGKTFPTPVLLVHGAAHNANHNWIHPFSDFMPDGVIPADKQGFAVTLSNLGYSVFAVSFAHNQGDNFMQAEQLANAVSRIKVLLNRTNDPNFKVDIVAHSKGNLAARLYCSDAASLYPNKTFLTPFRGDVRKYIAVGSPMRGIDTPFRYYSYNLSVAGRPNHYNAPIAADKILLYGQWKSMADRSIFPDKGGNAFPGQCQLLYNLVRDGGVPLGDVSYTPADANLTMRALYYGGRSLFVDSRGIDAAIEAGERLIYRLEERGLDPRVQLGVIAGTNPFLAGDAEDFGGIPMPYEFITPPGDGIVFLASSCHLDGILRRGARLLALKKLNLNHLDLTRTPEAVKALDSLLMDGAAIKK